MSRATDILAMTEKKPQQSEVWMKLSAVIADLKIVLELADKTSSDEISNDVILDLETAQQKLNSAKHKLGA